MTRKLAISNIAWAPNDRDAAYGLMKRHGIRGLEVAPGLLFHGCPDPLLPSEERVERERAAMQAHDLVLVSMQSLLFGVDGAALFENDESRNTLKKALIRAIDFAGRLKIPNLVFGSPRQRVVPADMASDRVLAIAVETFRELGDAAQAAGTQFGLEFNPVAYGTNFLNRADEALAMVEAVDHPAVTLILDLGAMHMNGEFSKVEDLIARAVSHISHVHVSEPHLAPAPASADQIAIVFKALDRAGYTGWASIEMKQTATPLDDMDRVLGRFCQAAGQAKESGA